MTLQEQQDYKDPTANVLKHVEGAVKRQDDLMSMFIEHQKELRLVDNERGDKLREADSRRINELMIMQTGYEDKLREAESNRINAIRAVDVNNASVDREKTAQQAQVLATQLTVSADTIRNQFQTSTTDMNDRIAKIEKAQYESAGKSGVTDPRMTELFEKFDILAKSQTTTKGESTGQRNMVGWIVAGVLALIAVLTYLSTLPL